MMNSILPQKVNQQLVRGIHGDCSRDIMAYHVTEKKYIDSILREGLVPRIGPRSMGNNEEAARVYFFPSEEEVETALCQWLGDEFGEDAELALLEVMLPAGTYSWSCEWELTCHETIPPERIRVLEREI